MSIVIGVVLVGTVHVCPQDWDAPVGQGFDSVAPEVLEAHVMNVAA
jgi:hypothetical protein